MTTRNLQTTITIGGAIAGSLPSSTKRAVGELNKLKIAQQQDVAESARLKTAIRGLARGSDDYKTRVQQLKDVQQRINYRTDDIGRVGAATRTAGSGVGGLSRRFSALKAGLGPVGLALGAIAGIALGLGAAFSRAGSEANSILLTSAKFGVSSEGIQRGTAYMREFTQDAGQARQNFESLLKVGQDFERVRFGEQLDPRRFLAAARLGINVNDLIQGEIDPTALFEQVAAGFSDLAPEEARLRAEVLLGPELGQLAAAVADGNLSVEEANRRAESARILSDQQLTANQAMGQNIDEIRQQITELLNQVTSFLVPPIADIAQKLTGYLSPEEQLQEARERFDALPANERLGPDVAGQPNAPIRERRPFREALGKVADERIIPNLPFGADQAFSPRSREDIGRGFGAVRDRVGASIPKTPSDLIPSIPEAIQEHFKGLLPSSLGDLTKLSIPESTLERLRGLVPESLGNLGGLGKLIGRQTGGITRAGETTLVGEDGPEIARFPAGTEIIPNERVARAGYSSAGRGWRQQRQR